jgi:isopenicillin N synthase-like dioxygenase
LFQLINHGIPLELSDAVLTQGHAFFDLPFEEKLKYAPKTGVRGYMHSLKDNDESKGLLFESLNFYPPVGHYISGRPENVQETDTFVFDSKCPNALGDQMVWPSEELHELCDVYTQHIERLARNVISVIATSLGDSNLFTEWTRDIICSMRIAGYPVLNAQSSTDDISVNFNPHKDAG